MKRYFKFKNEKEDRRLERQAERHYKLNLFRKCLQSLKYYSQYRKRKQIQKLKLKDYADAQLVYRVYQTWLAKLEFKQTLNQIGEQINAFQVKYQLTRVFHVWRRSCQNRLSLKEKEKQMKKYYEKKLKANVFGALFQNYQVALNERIDLFKAEKFYVFWQKKISFSHWTDRLEDKNEIKLMHLVYKARRHFQNKITRKCLLYWKVYRLQRLELNVSSVIASDQS